MKAQIESEPAFSVIGIEGSGKADEGPRWIGPLWEQAHKRRGEIEHLLKSDREAWGLMSAIEEYLAAWEKEGKYLAGGEILGWMGNEGRCEAAGGMECLENA